MGWNGPWRIERGWACGHVSCCAFPVLWTLKHISQGPRLSALNLAVNRRVSEQGEHNAIRGIVAVPPQPYALADAMHSIVQTADLVGGAD